MSFTSYMASDLGFCGGRWETRTPDLSRVKAAL